jgi:hypothetical protein
MQALFEFSASFVDAVAPDVRAVVREAREAFAAEIDAALPPGLDTYWDGDDYVIDLTPEQTAVEFGAEGMPPQPRIRQALLTNTFDAKKAMEEVLADA